MYLAYVAAGLAVAAAMTYLFESRDDEMDALLALERDLDRALADAYLTASVDCPAKACLARQLRGRSLDAAEQAMTSLEHVLEVHPEFAVRPVAGTTVPEIMDSVLVPKSSAPP